MKKILKNKKGFTLIELLAVIVVLAIIMVIATQQVNKTIQKSRANSFVESYQMMYKSVKGSAIQGNTAAEAESMLDYSDDYKVTVAVSGTEYRLAVCAQGATINIVEETKSDGTKEKVAKESGNASGKFSNMDLTTYYETKKDGTGGKSIITSNIGNNYRLTKHCITSSYNTSTD